MARRQTVDRIENAAVALFAENGYKGTSTRKIAQAAGVSELTIYRCYKTKEELFLQVLQRRMPDEWLNGVEIPPDRPLEEQLSILFAKLYQTLEERKDLIRIFYRGGSESPDVVELARQIPPKVWDPVEQELRKLCPAISHRVAKQVAFQVFSSYLGLCMLSMTLCAVVPATAEDYHSWMAKTCAALLRVESER